MTESPAYLAVSHDPVPDPAAVVIEGHARFTVLTSRLIRMEYAPDARFEDRPSQPFWYRRRPVPDITIERTAGGLLLQTEHLALRFHDRGDGFRPETLSVALRGSDTVWHYGDADNGNLGGTTRMLDKVDGRTPLEPGLLSRAGWVVVDDSDTLVFNADGWLEPRDAVPGTRDLYFFGYGHAYAACLRDYAQVAGPTPLLPRWVLGNWWSRYWAYSADELQELMTDFRAHEVPLSVCIVDMDWHLVDVGPGVNGWTGYTWNRELFPDPPAFLSWLHAQGLRTALNLHPALGVRPYEAAYPEMARRLGLDPTLQQTIPFEIADPDFAQAYFEELHHPQEADGVDFWWIDWQQGEQSRLPGLDPLWWLNHLHYYDLGREGKRPFIFSRWGGLGNHRYPIGFSGDTVVSWASLAFQPTFTATAANVGYGWWSHDIGGHMEGVEDRELYTRWVQFGVFSPIFRLHSTKNLFHERRPWGYDAEVLRITRDAMQLRHALIPTIYTLSWLNETKAVAPVRPLYHDYPEHDEAYVCPQSYLFGSDLMVAPYTSPADPDTRLSRQVVWLPPGDWYDFFSGRHYAGESWQALYGDLPEVPVFARAGAVVVLGPRTGWGGVDVPASLHAHCFAGADGRFTLFEDSGEGMGYRQGASALTEIEQTWQETSLSITVQAATGDASLTPAVREITLHVIGVSAQASAIMDGGDTPLPATYDVDREVLLIGPISVPRGETLTVRLTTPGDAPMLSRRVRTAEAALRLVGAFRMESLAKMALANALPRLVDEPVRLTALELQMTPSQVRAVWETLLEAGAHALTGVAESDTVVLWNNREDPRISYTYRWFEARKWHAYERYHGESDVVPRFAAITPQKAVWQLSLAYPSSTAVEVLRAG
jgi:alpha-glucosidase (family GH31 glycosyl hydrolase)